MHRHDGTVTPKIDPSDEIGWGDAARVSVDVIGLPTGSRAWSLSFDGDTPSDSATVSADFFTSRVGIDINGIQVREDPAVAGRLDVNVAGQTSMRDVIALSLRLGGRVVPNRWVPRARATIEITGSAGGGAAGAVTVSNDPDATSDISASWLGTNDTVLVLSSPALRTSSRARAYVSTVDDRLYRVQQIETFDDAAGVRLFVFLVGSSGISKVGASAPPVHDLTITVEIA